MGARGEAGDDDLGAVLGRLVADDTDLGAVQHAAIEELHGVLRVNGGLETHLAHAMPSARTATGKAAAAALAAGGLGRPGKERVPTSRKVCLQLLGADGTGGVHHDDLRP